MVQCEECNMWHLVFSKYKLKAAQCQKLQQVISDYSYTCGAKFEDLSLEKNLRMSTLRIIHVGTQLRNFTTQLVWSQYVSIAQLNGRIAHKSIILNVKHVLIFLESKSDVHCFIFFVFLVDVHIFVCIILHFHAVRICTQCYC